MINAVAPNESREIKYVKPNGVGIGLGKTVSIIIGGFLILIAIPILFGGGARASRRLSIRTWGSR